MKRLTILISVFLLASTAINAQFFSYGLKGGLNSSKMQIDRTTIEGLQTTDGARDFIIEQGDSEFGLHFGVFGRIKIAGVFVQPELLFTQAKGNFVITEQDPSNPQNVIENVAEQRFNRFDVPVMVGYKLGPAKLFLGPVATFTLSEKDGLKNKMVDLIGETGSVETAVSKAVFGYQVGIGIDILKFATFDIKYEGNLSKFGDNINIQGTDYKFDQRNPMWIFSLGIFL